MSQIRKQSILSTFFIYVGFVIGFVNTYLFTRQGSSFSPSEYGMTVIFIAVGSLMYSFSNLGTVGVVYKFYPYYNDRLQKKDNDLLTWSLLLCGIGFLIVSVLGVVFKDFVVRKFAGNSPLFIHYYQWTFPFGLGLLLFSLLEAFGWNIRKPIFTTFLREVMFKLFTFVLILAVFFGWLHSFDGFIKIYSFSYLAIAVIMMFFLIYYREFHITFKISRVTRKFYKKLTSMSSLVYGSGLVFSIAQYIDMLIIMSLLGTEAAGIFTLGMVTSGLVQAPQRGAVSATTSVLAQSWKNKDYSKISLIYKRSGINLLIASLGLFLLVWLNYTDAVATFKLKPVYIESLWVFFFFGLAKVVDLGTGVNSQIIATSSFWRFEFISGVILLLLIVPLNYILIRQFGIVGAGYTHLISMGIYNLIRILFLYRKFKMHPFTSKTLLAIVAAVASYLICYFLLDYYRGIGIMFLRSVLFILLFGSSIFAFNLTPDAIPVLRTVGKRLRIISDD